MSWRLSPTHIYLLFLIAAVSDAACFAEMFRTEKNGRLVDAVVYIGLALFLLGEAFGYIQYFRQKRRGKKRPHTSKKQKRREDPWIDLSLRGGAHGGLDRLPPGGGYPAKPGGANTEIYMI